MIHRHYVSDLFGESGEYRTSQGETIGKTTFYTQYLKALSISPLKDENHRAYVTHDQKQLLDEYHRRRCEGKTSLNEFLAELGSTQLQSTIEPVQNTPELVQSPLWLAFLEALTPRLAPPTDPLSPQKQLQEISDRAWQVSSSQLKAILNTSSVPPNRYGFNFTKVGKSGRELSWVVQKI
jgi:hypothetical protein